jgi:hypothetical protein
MDFFEVIWDFFLKLEVVKICFTFFVSSFKLKHQFCHSEERGITLVDRQRLAIFFAEFHV